MQYQLEKRILVCLIEKEFQPGQKRKLKRIYKAKFKSKKFDWMKPHYNTKSKINKLENDDDE